MTDMQKLGLFLAELFNKLGAYQSLVAQYQARITELENQLNND